MAWNGRNESILGAKPISPVAEPAAAAASSAPTPKQATESSLNNDRNTTASTTTSATNTAATTTKTTGAAAAPPPPPNAWNGKNSKIMEFRNVGKVVPVVSSNTKEKETASSTPPVVMMSVISKKPDVIVDKASLRSSSTTSQGNSSCDKKNLNNHNKKNYVIKALSKEDETTSSTAGSSTTNTTIDEDPSTSTSPVLLEGNLVTTTVAVTAGAAAATTAANTASNNSSSERELTNNKRNSSPPSTADVKLPSRSNSADPSFTNSHSNNSRQNSHQQGRNNADSSDHHAHFVRRGNNRGGGSSGSNRGSNTNNNHNQSSSGKNNNNTASRGNASTGSGRRRGNKNEMPICSFFLQGLCTRGTSCNFRHDPSASADPTTSMNNTLVSFPSSSNNINSNKQNTIVSPNQSTYHHRPPAVTTNNQIMNAMATSFVPSKRVFDPYKARAIQLAKEAQDEEDRSSYSSSFITKNMSKGLVEGTADISEEKKTEEIEDPPFFSIDVECVATGYGSCARGINDGCGNEGRNKEGVPPFQFNDRSHRYPGRVAMMDSDGNVVADIIIRPPKDGAGVLSYLTPLTGLTAELCLGEDAISLEEAVGIIKAALPKNGVIVGQAIDHDVEWLGLTAGKDFDRTVDISEIFRQRVPSILNEAVVAIKEKEADGGATTDGSEEDKSSDEYLGFATRYRHFSLRHVCLNLLGEDIQSGIHDPIIDAKYSLLLFHKYRNSSVTQLRIVRDGLHRAPPTPGFAAEKTPVIEGVCVSRAGYPYKRAARKIWRWFSARRGGTEHETAAVGARGP